MIPYRIESVHFFMLMNSRTKYSNDTGFRVYKYTKDAKSLTFRRGSEVSQVLVCMKPTSKMWASWGSAHLGDVRA